MNVSIAHLEHQFRSEAAERDGSRPRFFHRVVAEAEGQVLGTAVVHEDLFLPQRWLVASVLVDPSARGRGVGTLLTEALEDVARPWRPEGFQVRVALDDPDSRRWAERRGFRYFDDELTCVLRLAEWPRPALGPSDDSIRIVELADGDSEMEEALFDLLARLVPDAGANTATEPLSAGSVRRNLRAWGPIVPGATMMAKDADGWVGVSLATSLGEKAIYTVFTGVHPRRRGQGLATALKCRAIESARALGAVRMVSHVRSTNSPMLALNRRLGSQLIADVVLLRRHIGPDPDRQRVSTWASDDIDGRGA
jgi:GNAT superfamily N-acetyltransferase